MVLTEIGLAKVFQRIKSFVIAQLNSKASVLHTHTSSDITDLPNGYVPRSGGKVITGVEIAKTTNNEALALRGCRTGNSDGASIIAYGADYTYVSSLAGCVSLRATNSTNGSELVLKPNGTATVNNNGTTKNLAMQEDVVPRSGGAVLEGVEYKRNVDTSSLYIEGGNSYRNGGMIAVFGQYSDNTGLKGCVELIPSTSEIYKFMELHPNGTWIWTGQAVQLISDQRLKQQITEIDDKLLDAWQDVELCQFKYNDAVNEKGDKARLHTGFVVQQIDSACKKHGVDISTYGLYCHEVYPEETEEVEIEQADGTKVKEKKVIREASEHYSLRYTEALIVECKYLRRENARLKENLAGLEERLEKLEKAENQEK